MKMNLRNKRLAVKSLFFLALPSAASSALLPLIVSAIAAAAFIALGWLTSQKLSEYERSTATALCALDAVLCAALISANLFSSSIGLAACLAVLGATYAVFKMAIAKTPLEAKVVSTENRFAVVEVGDALLSPVPSGLYEINAHGLKKGEVLKVKAVKPLWSKTRLELA
ncbi:hypothetical protein AUJ65_05705 [Candidatus Micrarchaeota archaeon CG1_02_51_15]|nr:MAG: hypothetical protein AUJ65_05705 [Candidatus Micrarchaeota archaeon CG1_02_51_15]